MPSAGGLIRLSFTVQGMTCSSCAARIEKRLAELSGAVSPSVNFATLRASVDFDLGLKAAAASQQDNTTIQSATSLSSTSSSTNLREFYLSVQSLITKLGYKSELLGASRKRFALIPQEGSIPDVGDQSATVEHAVLSTCLGVLEVSVAHASSSSAYAATVDVLTLDAIASSAAESLEKAIMSAVSRRGYRVVKISPSSSSCVPIREEERAVENHKNCSSEAPEQSRLLSLDEKDEDKGENSQMVSALEMREEIHSYRNRFFGSLVFSAPLMIAMFVFMFDHSLMSFEEKHAKVINCVYMGFATPAVVYFGRDYFINAFKNLRLLHFTMDTLVAFGVGGAYVFSIVALVLLFLDIKATCYFDTAAELVTFMLLGKYLESLAKAKTSDALVLLLRLTPPTANLIQPSPLPDTDSSGKGDRGRAVAGEEVVVVVVPSASLKKGDRVRVAAGEKIPVDGEVVDGVSEVDESAVTGESLPRHVAPGAKVVGGTVNTVSVLTVVATAVGGDTVVSQIIRIVEDAQQTKPAIQRFADRIAAVFVPCVITVSATVFIVWSLLGYFGLYPAEWRGSDEMSPYVFAFQNFLSTLVVACPCALGLAAPTAVMVGTGVGAEMGVLSKSGIVLETAPLIDTFIFDKTGTLTTGKLAVTSAFYFDSSESSRTSSRPDVEQQQQKQQLIDAVATVEESYALKSAPTSTLTTSTAVVSPHQIRITTKTATATTEVSSLSPPCRTALSAVALVESMATHPIAVAIAAHIAKDLATITAPSAGEAVAERGASTVLNHTVIGGKGVAADVNGSHIRVGTLSFITDDSNSPLSLLKKNNNKNKLILNTNDKKEESSITASHDNASKQDASNDDAHCEDSATEGEEEHPTAKLLCSSSSSTTIQLPDGAKKALAEMTAEGRTIVAASVDGFLVALFGLADEPKPEARAVVSYLRDQLRKKVMMVTGDNPAAAMRIARAVGIAACDVRASCMPAEKERIVAFEQRGGDSSEVTVAAQTTTLKHEKDHLVPQTGRRVTQRQQQQHANYDTCAVAIDHNEDADDDDDDDDDDDGDRKETQSAGVDEDHTSDRAPLLDHGDRIGNKKKKERSAVTRRNRDGQQRRVAFIGDGINDSPALAQSDLGIALGAGTDIAVECADAVLMRDDLTDIITFISLATTVVRRIRFNFAWAIGYNLIMLPVAAGALYPVIGKGLPPVVAGIAMILSSLSVLASSLALRCFSRRRIAG